MCALYFHVLTCMASFLHVFSILFLCFFVFLSLLVDGCMSLCLIVLLSLPHLLPVVCLYLYVDRFFVPSLHALCSCLHISESESIGIRFFSCSFYDCCTIMFLSHVWYVIHLYRLLLCFLVDFCSVGLWFGCLLSGFVLVNFCVSLPSRCSVMCVS